MAPTQLHTAAPFKAATLHDVARVAGVSLITASRALSNPMGKAFGHPVVVENLPGAGGMPGTLQVVKAPKDGLTLGLIFFALQALSELVQRGV